MITGMSDDMRARAALAVAQEYLRAVEAKEIDGVARTLATDVRQLFMHSKRGTGGFCVADVKGKREVLAYTTGLIAKFTPLVWRAKQWTVADDGSHVVFTGTGDMVVERTGKPYRNSYVTRFDVVDGTIVRMVEYGDAFLYAGLGIKPNAAEFRSLLRALGRMVTFRWSPA